MPIYVFSCPSCNGTFEVYAKIGEYKNDCPFCSDMVDDNDLIPSVTSMQPNGFRSDSIVPYTRDSREYVEKRKGEFGKAEQAKRDKKREEFFDKEVIPHIPGNGIPWTE